MISRYHQHVPTKREEKAVRRELRTVTTLNQAPLRLTSVTEAGHFGGSVNLGVFPQPKGLASAEG